MEKLIKMPTKESLFESVQKILKENDDVLIRCYPDGNVIIYRDSKKVVYNGNKN